MEFLPNTDPDVLKSKTSGSALLFFFGLPFFVSGCFIIAIGLEIIKFEGDPPGLGAVPFGFIFMLVGALVMFGRSGLIMEKRTNTIRKWYGLLIPMIIRKYPLNVFTSVSMKKETRRSKNSSYTVYAVRLEGEQSIKALDISAPKDYQEARKVAEQISKFLSAPISDFTSGKEIIREHDKLDESVAEKIKRTGEKVELPPQPTGTRSIISEAGGQVTIEIPPTGFNGLHVLQLMLPVVFFLFALIFFMVPASSRGENLPPPAIFVFFVVFFLLVPLGVMLINVLPKIARVVNINVSRHLITFEETVLFRKKFTEIPAEELEELEIGEHMASQIMDGLEDAAKEAAENPDFNNPEQQVLTDPKTKGCIGFIAKFIPGPQIVARSDKTSVKFGQGLSHEELTYIHSLIKKVIAG